MSSAESWDYTSREFDARVRVYNAFKEADHRRWCIERAERLNGPLTRLDKRLWSEQDFMGGAVSDKSPIDRKVSEENQIREFAWRMAGLTSAPVSRRGDESDLALELHRDRNLAQQMRKKDFDEKLVPSWARMTDEEKKQRGIQ